jgi:hypothetical protein
MRYTLLVGNVPAGRESWSRPGAIRTIAPVRRPSLAAVLVIATASAPAVAQEAVAQSHVVLAQPVVPEAVPVSVVRQIVVRMAEGLVEAGLDVSVDPFPAGACAEAGCLRDMARAHGAAAVVLTRMTAEGQNYRVRIDLVDGASGQPVGDVDRACNFCAYDELSMTFLEATRALIHEQTARQRTPSPPLRLVHRAEVGRPTDAAWAAVGLGLATVAAGAVLLAVELHEPAARAPAVMTIGAGALLAGGGASLLLFWPETDARGRIVGATAGVRASF